MENQEKFYRLALSYAKNKEDALDIVQNAIVKALESYGGIRNLNLIRTWFYRVLVNESLSYLRKQKGEILCDAENIDLIPAESNMDMEDNIYQQIGQLSSEIKTVILLRFYEEMTLNEIAHITKTKLSTVKYRLYTGLRKLKLAIKEDDL